MGFPAILWLVAGILIGFLLDWLLFRRWFGGETNHLRHELHESEARAHELTAQLTAANAAVEAQQAEAVAAADQIAALEAQIGAAQAAATAEQAALEAQAAELSGALQACQTAAAEREAALQAEIDRLTAALAAAQVEATTAEAALAETATEYEEALTELAHDAADPGEPDDLKRIEGVGPKIEATLNAAGLTTFAHIAQTSAARLAEIIADVRGNHVTDTWPEQAALAAAGEWDRLEALQDALIGGRRG